MAAGVGVTPGPQRARVSVVHARPDRRVLGAGILLHVPGGRGLDDLAGRVRPGSPGGGAPSFVVVEPARRGSGLVEFVVGADRPGPGMEFVWDEVLRRNSVRRSLPLGVLYDGDEAVEVLTLAGTLTLDEGAYRSTPVLHDGRVFRLVLLADDPAAEAGQRAHAGRREAF